MHLGKNILCFKAIILLSALQPCFSADKMEVDETDKKVVSSNQVFAARQNKRASSIEDLELLDDSTTKKTRGDSGVENNADIFMEEGFMRKEKDQDSMLFSLPNEVLVHLVSYLSVVDWAALSLTCKTTDQTLRDPYAWKQNPSLSIEIFSSYPHFVTASENPKVYNVFKLNNQNSQQMLDSWMEAAKLPPFSYDKRPQSVDNFSHSDKYTFCLLKALYAYEQSNEINWKFLKYTPAQYEKARRGEDLKEDGDVINLRDHYIRFRTYLREKYPQIFNTADAKSISAKSISTAIAKSLNKLIDGKFIEFTITEDGKSEVIFNFKPNNLEIKEDKDFFLKFNAAQNKIYQKRMNVAAEHLRAREAKLEADKELRVISDVVKDVKDMKLLNIFFSPMGTELQRPIHQQEIRKIMTELKKIADPEKASR